MIRRKVNRGKIEKGVDDEQCGRDFLVQGQQQLYVFHLLSSIALAALDMFLKA